MKGVLQKYYVIRRVKMNRVESFAAVTQLETKKSPAETYQTFYELFGDRALMKKGWHMVLNRVLHFDQDDRRDVHVVLGRHSQSINPPMFHRRSSLGLPMHLIPYKADDFMAAVTDGQTISPLDVISVTGTYRNHINGIGEQYDPAYEKMQLKLRSGQGIGRAEFQCSTGNGVFDLHEYPTGWILSQQESERQKESILLPLVAQNIGHTAVAS